MLSTSKESSMKTKISIGGVIQNLIIGLVLLLCTAVIVAGIAKHIFDEPYDKATQVWVLGQCTTVCKAMSKDGDNIKSKTPMNIGQTMYLTCYKNRYFGPSCDDMWKTKRSHEPSLDKEFP